MKYFLVYDKLGKILRTGICPAADFELQVNNDSESVIEGYANYEANYIEAGVVVAMPPKPSEFHVFDYTTKQWIDPRTPETEWPLMRAKRDRLLQASDWAALPDVPLTTEKRAEWAAYRQALRDVTQQPDPFNIVWPTPPQ